MTNKEFKIKMLSAAAQTISEYPTVRYGQAVFNEVGLRWPGVARKAQFDYGVDCFYDDSKVSEFLDVCYNIVSDLD